MSVQLTEQRSVSLSRENLLAFVRGTIGGWAGRPSDEDPLPHGPWDPYIRKAVDVLRLAGPQPEPWRALGSILSRAADEEGLNPQPLPPRYGLLTLVAQIAVDRTVLLQEIAQSTSGAERGIIIVGGIPSRLTDEWCGNGFRLRWPGPGPVPPWWPHRLDGFDLMVMATQFEVAAREAFTTDLRGSFERAAGKFAEAGFSRLQFGQ